MQVSRRLGVTAGMVRTWRRRFLERDPDGLSDEPRPGAPRKVTDADVERVIIKTLEEQPQNTTHWPTRSMAATTGMPQSAIPRIRRAFTLAPHRSQTFKPSADPLFIDKVRDVAGLYLDPPEKALVLCVDEKSHRPPRASLSAPHGVNSRGDRMPALDDAGLPSRAEVVDRRRHALTDGQEIPLPAASPTDTQSPEQPQRAADRPRPGDVPMLNERRKESTARNLDPA